MSSAVGRRIRQKGNARRYNQHGTLRLDHEGDCAIMSLTDPQTANYQLELVIWQHSNFYVLRWVI